jgi:Domain of unknown function (DUF4440)
MTPAQVKNAEVAWSQAIRVGCSPSRRLDDRQTIKTFLEKTLANDYTNIDHLGKVRSKKQDLANCVKGRYVVNGLTPPKMKIRIYGDSCAVVVGRDKVQATFKGQDVGGKFIWTDTWVKFGKAWKCVASHGSKL